MKYQSFLFKPLPTTSKIFLLSFMTMLLAFFPPEAHQYSHAVALPSHYGGTLVWGTVNPPTLINPVLTSHSVSSALLSLIFDSLVRIDSTGKAAPGLAQSWEVSQDGLRYTFHLHPHVYFHDGIECTAEDVKFTYEAIQNPLNKSHWRNTTEMMKEWRVIDPYTLQLTLSHPTPDIFVKLAREILPKHLYEGKNFLTNSHNFTPIGTGPFYFVSWNPVTNEITLKANTQYFEGRPFLDKIIVKVYKNNSTLWAALMRQEVDFVKFLNQKDYEILSQDASFKTYQIPSGLYFAIVYNLNEPLLYDRELRRAISYAIDRRALMEAVGINGIESNGPFYPQSPWFNKNVEPASYDPARTREILNERGWKQGPEGLLKKGRQTLVLSMLVNRNRPDCRQMAQILRQQLSEVGIGLRIIFYNSETELTPGYLAKVKPHMWLRMFLGNNSDPSEMVRSWYSSSSEFGILWPHQDKNIDQLFQQALSIKDGGQRAGLYQKIHALIDADQPACFLFFSVIYNAVSAKINNTENFFNDHMPGYLMKQWFISTERG